MSQMDPLATPVPMSQRPTLTEQLAERLKNRPDQYTVAWWKQELEGLNARFDEALKAYRGACHSINMAITNTKDNEARLVRFQAIIETTAAENNMLQAMIGEMKAEMDALRLEMATCREENAVIQRRIADMARWAASKGKPAFDDASK